MDESRQWKEEFLEVLCNRNLDEDGRKSAFDLKTEHLPRKLFKYCAFDEQYTESLLRRGEVWLSNPAKFNDPFDSACAISFNEIGKEKEDLPRPKNESILVKLERGDSLGLPESLRCFLLKEKEAWGRKASRVATRWLTNSLRDCLSISCFSETGTNVPMWAHYANQHRGFCCEWDLDSWAQEDLQKHLFPVSYTNTPLRNPPLLTNPHYPEAPWILALNKSTDWQYEREWRFIDWRGPASEGRVTILPPPTIVHLGIGMFQKDKLRIKNICRNTDVSVHEIVRDTENSRLVLETETRK